MKVRVLNGAHTAMVPVGYLAGCRTVKEVTQDQEVNQFVQGLLYKEIYPTLSGYQENEVDDFIASTMDRFKNPTLKHQLISIALNSTSKFVSRLLPGLKDYVFLYQRLPKRIVFGLSCLFLFYRGTYNDQRIEVNDTENVIDLFKEYWKQYDKEILTYLQLVSSLLGHKEIWGEDLNAIDGLAAMVTENLRNIQSHGVRNTLKQIENHNSLV